MRFLLLFLLSLPCYAQLFGAAPIYPVAVSVKTGSYTIPVKRWARVYVEVENGGTFTIDGVTAMDTDPLVAFSASNAGTSATSAHTVSSNYYSVGSAYNQTGSATGAYVFNANNFPASGAITGPHYLGAGQAIGYGAAAVIKNYFGVSIPGNAMNRSATINLPSGAVINGTGSWRATVEEYFQ